MKEKRYVKISLEMAVCIILIILVTVALILLSIYTYNLKKIENKGNIGYENVINNDENTIETQKNTVLEGNNITNTNKKKSEWKEIDINDSVVKAIIKKFNFKTYATASIYKAGNFSSENIPNDLVLRLGWDRIEASKKKLLNNPSKETVTKEIMKQSIANVFGNKINYKDSSFAKIDVNTFYGYEGFVGEERNYKL